LGLINGKVKKQMATNVIVRARNGDSSERLIRRFIKKVKKEKILEKYREKMRFIKPSDVRRMKRKRAIRKQELERLKQERQDG
jgi:ribosomal protein S21